MKKKVALLSFRANAESFSCPYRLQVRILVATSKNFKVFMYKFVANQSSVRQKIAKHISMLTEVKPLTVLLSSRGRFIFLKITELPDIYQSCQYQKILIKIAYK